jgi:putative ABC transport system permease protein
MMHAFVQDLRYGVRLISRAPGFATSAILTVALGIGVTTAVFTLVYGVVLRPLPYPEPDRLVSFWMEVPRLGLPRAFVGPAFYRDWVAQNKSFESLALVRHIGNFNLSGAGEPERLQGARITASLFDVLEVRPALGREFRVEEEQAGRELVVLLSDGLWMRRFGRNPQVVGQTMVLNGQPHVIVGVMPKAFAYPARDFDLWVPLVVDPEDYTTRANFSFLSIGRLKPGVSTRAAQSEMDAISARLAQQYSAGRVEVRAVVDPMRADLVRDVRRPLLTLLAAVASLLLIGCASLANLLIARAMARSGELVLRSALGASRGRLVRQSLTELLPILLAGGALGLLFARTLLGLAMPWLPPTLPRLESVTIGTPVLVFAGLLLAFTAIVSGVWPAFQAARWDVASALRESLRGTSTTLHGAGVRDALVVVQIGVAVLLTISAALLTRSFVNIRHVDPGFRAESVATMQLAIPRAKYPQDRQVAGLCHDILERVRRLPGVRAAGMVNRLPLGGVAQINRVELDRSALPEHVTVDSRSVSADYFSAMGIALKSGRTFTDADGPDAPPVGLIDERLARAAWPDGNAIGRRFRIPVADLPWVTIVGIVGHIRHDSLTTDARPQVYWHHLQRAQDRMALVVRTDGDASSLVRPLIAEIRAADPEQPVFDVRTMAAVVDRATGQQWLTAAVLATFAVLSLLMAAVGVYGVISYAVRLRAREFSIRMALGADRRDVLLMVVRRGAVLTGYGLGTGLASAAVMTRALTGLLHDVSSTDLVSFGVAAGALTVAALVATILPAQRAVGAEPMAVLRE